MPENLAPKSILTREFWSGLSNPTPAALGKSILSLLVLVKSFVCICWIFTLSGLGEGCAVIAGVPYVYLVVSYVSTFLFYRFERFGYFIFTQLVMLLMILGTRQSTPWFLLFIALVFISWKLNHYFAGNAMPIPTSIKDAFF